MHHILEGEGGSNFSLYFGSEGFEGFCKGVNVPRKMEGSIFAQNFKDFYGVV